MDVVTFGESMGSIRAAGLIRLGGAMSLTVGGAESNVAIGLSRLGHRAGWAGRVGDDEIGSLVLRTLGAEGVDITYSRVDPTRSTGLLLVEKRIGDISRVAYYRAGSAGSALTVADLDGVLDPAPRVLHITGITPALSPAAAEATEHTVEAARAAGTLVSFDVNYRAGLWGRDAASAALTRIALRSDIVFASDDELSLVATGSATQAALALVAAGVGEVVVKRGEHGASAWTPDGQASVAARAVRVVDTIGAGDAFTAGYLSALLDGLDLAARLDRGAILGAFAVSAQGDWEALPTRSELTLLDVAPGSTIR